MKKEEIIKLAKEIGFQSQFLHNKPYKYSNNEDLRWLFWLTELQKWLREKYEIHIQIGACNDMTFDADVFYIKIGISEYFELGFYSFEDALMNGIYFALTDINDKK